MEFTVHHIITAEPALLALIQRAMQMVESGTDDKPATPAKPKAAKPEPEPEPEPEAKAETPAQEETPSEPVKKTKYTPEQVRAYANEKNTNPARRAAIKALLTKAGVDNVRALPEEKFDEFYAGLEAL